MIVSAKERNEMRENGDHFVVVRKVR